MVRRVGGFGVGGVVVGVGGQGVGDPLGEPVELHHGEPPVPVPAHALPDLQVGHRRPQPRPGVRSAQQDGLGVLFGGAGGLEAERHQDLLQQGDHVGEVPGGLRIQQQVGLQGATDPGQPVHERPAFGVGGEQVKLGQGNDFHHRPGAAGLQQGVGERDPHGRHRPALRDRPLRRVRRVPGQVQAVQPQVDQAAAGHQRPGLGFEFPEDRAELRGFRPHFEGRRDASGRPRQPGPRSECRAGR